MSEAFYVGTADSVYEKSKLASRGINPISGFEWLIGTAYGAMAEEPNRGSYQGMQSAHYRLPGVVGYSPLRIAPDNHTYRTLGNEFRTDFYEPGCSHIGNISISEQPIEMSTDYERSALFDPPYVDQEKGGLPDDYVGSRKASH